jgi:hypothetical protein
MNKLPVILVIMIIVACHATQPSFQPVEPDITKTNVGPAVTFDDLKKGFKLYVSNCGGCHLLPVPSSKNISQWEKVLPEMFNKTELDAAQKQLIRQYIYSKL